MAKNKAILIIFFTLAFYIAMGIYADFNKLTEAVQSFQWSYFLLLIFFTTIGYFLRFLKWDIFLKKAGVFLPFRQNLFVFISGLSMIVTPGKIGEVWKSWIIRDISGDELNKTVPAVILDRVTDVMSLILLSTFGILSYREGIYLIIFLLLIIFVFYVSVRSKIISKKLILVLEKISGKYSTNVKTMHETFEKMMEPKTFISLSLLNSLAWLCECLGFYCVILGFNRSLSISTSTFIFSFASLAGGVSMIPGGIGLAEATITGFLQFYGFTPDIAIAASLLVRFGSFWYGVILGFVVYTTFRKSIMCKNEAVLDKSIAAVHEWRN